MVIDYYTFSYYVMDTMKDIFLDRLKILMQKENIQTQYEFAKRLGLQNKIVNNWFRGKALCPRDHYLRIIAEYFNVSMAWLRYGTKEYAPTLKDEVMRIAEELEEYATERPQELGKLKQIIDLFMSRDIVFSKKKETKEGKVFRHKAG